MSWPAIASPSPIWRTGLRGNPAVGLAIFGSFALLLTALVVSPVARLNQHAPAPPIGWFLAALAAPAVALVDALWKRWVRQTLTTG